MGGLGAPVGWGDFVQSPLRPEAVSGASKKMSPKRQGLCLAVPRMGLWGRMVVPVCLPVLTHRWPSVPPFPHLDWSNIPTQEPCSSPPLALPPGNSLIAPNPRSSSRHPPAFSACSLSPALYFPAELPAGLWAGCFSSSRRSLGTLGKSSVHPLGSLPGVSRHGRPQLSGVLGEGGPLLGPRQAGASWWRGLAAGREGLCRGSVRGRVISKCV